MKYDLTNLVDINKFNQKVKELIDKKEFVELKSIKQRTLRQNNYLHLILSYYAVHFGYSLEYVKRDIFKVLVNPSIFLVEKVTKDGEIYTDVLSTSTIDKSDLATAITRFQNHSSNGGLRLPEPNDLVYHREIMKLIEENKEFI